MNNDFSSGGPETIAKLESEVRAAMGGMDIPRLEGAVWKYKLCEVYFGSISSWREELQADVERIENQESASQFAGAFPDLARAIETQSSYEVAYIHFDPEGKVTEARIKLARLQHPNDTLGQILARVTSAFQEDIRDAFSEIANIVSSNFPAVQAEKFKKAKVVIGKTGVGTLFKRLGFSVYPLKPSLVRGSTSHSQELALKSFRAAGIPFEEALRRAKTREESLCLVTVDQVVDQFSARPEQMQ